MCSGWTFLPCTQVYLSLEIRCIYSQGGAQVYPPGKPGLLIDPVSFFLLSTRLPGQVYLPAGWEMGGWADQAYSELWGQGQSRGGGDTMSYHTG